MSSELPQQNKRYNFERVRTLFIKGFTDSELRDLCFDIPDFEPVYQQLAQNTGKAEIVRLLLEHTRQELLVDQLLTLAREHNPARYAEHEPYYLADAGQSPYRGLQYFDVNNAGLFFGREALTAKLAAHLLPSHNPGGDSGDRFLAVIGASGSGKSSLVRAGLIPALNGGAPPTDGYLSPNRSNRWLWHIITPTEHPLKKLATTLISDPGEVKAATALVDALATDPRSLDTAIHQILGQTSARRLLLVVDQFEELFTACKDEAERRAFVDNLMTAVTTETAGPISVVITFRADFYHHCAQYDILRETVARCQEYIGPMTAEELRQAIEEPAKRTRYDFEPGLVDLLLHDVSDEPGALPLLSHALLETWQRCRGHTLTLVGYQESEGVRGAIAKTAETVYEQLAPEQQVIARRIFLAVTELGEGTQDTRRRASLTELIFGPEEKPAIETLLKTLADARLIITGQNTVEVAHEALIREWPTLRKWLDDNRAALWLHRRLTETVIEWERNKRDPSYLYQGARLSGVEEWAETDGGDLNESERSFLATSLQARSRAERQKNILVAGLVTGLIVVAIAALFGFWGQARAIQERQRAESLAARNLAAAANGNLEIDPELSILLALQALSQRYTPDAEEALHRALQISRVELSIAEAGVEFRAVTFSPDGSRLVTADHQGWVKVWDAVSGEKSLAFMAHSQKINSVAFNSDGTRLATAGADEQAKVWDITSGKVLLIIPNDQEIWQAVFSPDGTRLATAGDDGVARIWDAESGQELLTLEGHKRAIISLDFSPDGQRLATASRDATVKIWDVSGNGKELLTLSGHLGEVNRVDFNPSGERLATAGLDGTAKVWDITSGKGQIVLSLGTHTSTVNDVAFSRDGAFLATASADRTAKVWDAVSGQEMFTLAGHVYNVTDLAFSQDGKHLATASQDGTVRVWNIGPSYELLTLLERDPEHPDNQVNSVAFSPDGDYLATTSDESQVKIWDIPSGKTVQILNGNTDGVRSVDFNLKGKLLATAGVDTTAIIWDLASGQKVYTLTGHTGVVWEVAFSADGTRLATASFDNTARVWEVASGQPLPHSFAHDDRVFEAAFSPDGKHLVTASADKTAKVWDIASGQMVYSLPHAAIVFGATFSPDGQRLTTASADGQVRIWNTQSGHEERILSGLPGLPGHSTRVYRAVFSPDGTHLATASADRTVIIWDLMTGQKLFTLFGHTDQVYDVAFSPDGSRLATAGRDGTVSLYVLKIEDLIELAHRRVTRFLRIEECHRYLEPEQCLLAP